MNGGCEFGEFQTNDWFRNCNLWWNEKLFERPTSTNVRTKKKHATVVPGPNKVSTTRFQLDISIGHNFRVRLSMSIEGEAEIGAGAAFSLSPLKFGGIDSKSTRLANEATDTTIPLLRLGSFIIQIPYKIHT